MMSHTSKLLSAINVIHDAPWFDIVWHGHTLRLGSGNSSMNELWK